MDRDAILSCISNPARYLGGEILSVEKDYTKVRLSFALVFPEVYEIAMSYLGYKILYDILARRSDVVAERVFAPWIDLMRYMYINKISPWSLESSRPLQQFDVIGFSLLYELTYTNALHMLRLAKIPLRRKYRGINSPLVIAGGPCMSNPEPMADFLDLVVVGEAEELINPLIDLLIMWKEKRWSREYFYCKAADLDGVYVPSLYSPIYKNGYLTSMRFFGGGLRKVRRRIVADLEKILPPLNQIIPLVKPIHDRFTLEIARGCTRGCRFCQAGYIYRPVRERQLQLLFESVIKGISITGMEELALLSLSAGDYSCINLLLENIIDILKKYKVRLNFPSLRLDSISQELIVQIKRISKTSFTLAPEVASNRLYLVINKDLTREQVLIATNRIFSMGWKSIKLYFMLGLPLEKDEDIVAIGELCSAIVNQARRWQSVRRVLVTVNLGLFVPKAHTPFQWQHQIDLDEAKRRLVIAKKYLMNKQIRVKWGSPEQSILEGVLSRGDRFLSKVLELVVSKGCCFDGWSDKLNYYIWLDAFKEIGLTIDDYLQSRNFDQVLPWDHIDVGVNKFFLLNEYKNALAEVLTRDCREGFCHNCGVCDHNLVKPRLALNQKKSLIVSINSQDDRHIIVVYYIRLEKIGGSRFLGHLDMMRQIRRAFRRIGFRLVYRHNSSPHPIIKYDSALSLGVESLIELLEISLIEYYNLEKLCEDMNKVLPEGLYLTTNYSYYKASLFQIQRITYLVWPLKILDESRMFFFNRADCIILLRDTPGGRRKIEVKDAINFLRLKNNRLKIVMNKIRGCPKPYEILQTIFGLSFTEARAARVIKIGLS